MILILIRKKIIGNDNFIKKLPIIGSSLKKLVNLSDWNFEKPNKLNPKIYWKKVSKNKIKIKIIMGTKLIEKDLFSLIVNKDIDKNIIIKRSNDKISTFKVPKKKSLIKK